jgi:hypothetical protein
MRVPWMSPKFLLYFSVGNDKIDCVTATRLVREWIDIRLNELEEDWELARAGKEVKKIAPLE